MHSMCASGQDPSGQALEDVSAFKKGSFFKTPSRLLKWIGDCEDRQVHYTLVSRSLQVFVSFVIPEEIVESAVRPGEDGALSGVDCLEKFYYECFLFAFYLLVAVFGFGVLTLGYLLFLSLFDC